MAPATNALSDIQKHLALVSLNGESSGTNEVLTGEQLRSIPLFSSMVRKALDMTPNAANSDGAGKELLPEFGLIGMCLETYGEAPLRQETTADDASDEGKQRSQTAADSLVYANINAPWSTFICGSQGSGKSHTLSCMLENCLLAPSKTGAITTPLTGLVLHYDKFTGIETGQLCEAEYLCSSGIPVRVLVSPSNFTRMKILYSNLPGLPKDATPPQVLPMKFPQKYLTIGMITSLMAAGDNGTSPLYMEVVTKLLRDMATEGRVFDFGKFKARLRKTQWVKGQSGPLKMRMELLESFLDLAPPKKRKDNVWNFENGTLTIIDLSCPFVDENDACALFNICLGMFLEGHGKGGRIVALDEAHKFLTAQSNEAVILTETMLSIIRQQRHLAARVIIATQEPTLSPSLLDLCNVSIVHRFSSPAWFKMLQNHLAGAVITGSESKQSAHTADNIFSKIVCLRTGEALVFSLSSILHAYVLVKETDNNDNKSSDSESEDKVSEAEGRPGSSASDDSKSSGSFPMEMERVQFRELGPRYIKLRVRHRVTADGGRSILNQ